MATENVSVVFAPLASVTCVASLPSPPTVRLTVWVPLTSPTFSTVASTVSVSPSTTGAFVPAIATEKFAGSCTVTPTLAVSSAEEIVAVYESASPLPVARENVSVVFSPAFSDTDSEVLPSDPASRVTACVLLSLPTFSMTASTVSVSPSTTGAFVPAIATEKFAGPCTVTVVLAVSLADETAAV